MDFEVDFQFKDILITEKCNVILKIQVYIILKRFNRIMISLLILKKSISY